MKVFTHNKFTGFYPVGTAALIVAINSSEALAELNAALENRGLFYSDAKEADLEEINLDHQAAHILCDGNY